MARDAVDAGEEEHYEERLFSWASRPSDVSEVCLLFSCRRGPGTMARCRRPTVARWVKVGARAEARPCVPVCRIASAPAQVAKLRSIHLWITARGRSQAQAEDYDCGPAACNDPCAVRARAVVAMCRCAPESLRAKLRRLAGEPFPTPYGDMPAADRAAQRATVSVPRLAAAGVWAWAFWPDGLALRSVAAWFRAAAAAAAAWSLWRTGDARLQTTA